MHSRWSISAFRTRTARPAQSAGSAAPPSASAMATGSAVICDARDDVGHLVAPEGGHGRQHPALVGDGLGHDHVERADPVRGHHEEAAVAGVVELAHLARVDPWQVHRHGRGHGRAGHRSASASAKRSTWRSVRVRSKAALSCCRVQRHLGVGLEHGRGRGAAPPRPAGRRVGRSGRPRRASARPRPAPAGRTGRRRGRACPRSGSAAPARGAPPGRRPARSPCAACSRPAWRRRAAPPARPSCARCRARATAPRPPARRRGSRAAAGPARTAAPRGSGCACAAWPSCPSGRRRTAPPPRRARCGPGAGSRCT